MTPTPPEGFEIIPREWLEAGNPLPEDAIVWNGVLKCWIEAELAGCPTGVIRPYATAQPLPCFDSAPEHNPDNLTPEQVGEGWRLLLLDEVIEEGDLFWSPKFRQWTLSYRVGGQVKVTDNTYRRRVAPEPEQARNNALNKLAYEQSGGPRTECPTCAGMNDLVATQGQRIAELEREIAQWKKWAEYANERFTKETGKDLQTAM